MAITAYIGINGSGKSYECVSNVIVNGVLAGRRVVTNIVGIQPELIREYCVTERKATPESLGSVVAVTDEQCTHADFLPYKGDDGKCTTHTLCQAGDLIVLDELWRLFGSGLKLTSQQQSFFAEHRHFTHPETGISCDFAFMSQELSGISRFIRDRIDKTFRMKKLNAVGMNKSYRVDVYDGHKLIKAALISSYHNRYKAKVFPLYQSHDNGNGVEVVVDKRQSLLTKKFIFVRVALPLILFVCGLGYLVNFFSTSKQTDTTNTDTEQGQPVDNPEAYQRLTRAPENYPRVTATSEYRIAGRLSRRGRDYIILQGADGRFRFEPATLFSDEDGFLSGLIDGQTVTLFSGRKS